MMNSVTWKIGGEAGFGIMSAGIMMSKIMARMGYYTFATNEYPSLIRGGHNLITLRMSTEKIEAMNRDLHILISLNKHTADLHLPEMSAGSIMVFDPKDYDWKESDLGGKKVKLLSVPLSEITRKFGGEPVMRNTVAMAASLALLGAPFEGLEKLMTEQFKRKGDEVVKLNVSVARAGYDHIVKEYGSEKSMYLPSVKPKEKQLIINGSEALGVAAVRAGLKFAAIYPMTPINSLITYLADHSKKYNLVYKQPEDEIAGINMAVGASYAGVRSMVATSGGGFALMVEGLALAGMLEVPLVIDMGMRVGPATGMPTWTEQGELRFIIHAGHGEFARIVLAPGDAEEIFQLTVDAFHLADKYQVPVFLLTDKYLNESNWCVAASVYSKPVVIDRGGLLKKEDLANERDFKRYRLDGEGGVSPRSTPGTANGWYIANAYEHDEFGLVTEDPAQRTQMADKRLKKMATITSIAKPPTLYGDPTADIVFVNWGTTKGAIIEAMKIMGTRGVKSRLVHFTWLYPFPTGEVKKMLTGAKRIVDVEQNATGQLASLIREYTGIEITEKILKYDGRPFYPEEIVERMKI